MISQDPLIKYVDKEVYHPSEDTYLMIDFFNNNISPQNVDGLKLKEVRNILDMGTGTGIIAIFFQLLKRKLSNFNPRIFASDISEEAISCAKRNEKTYSFKDHITFIKSDLFQSFPSELNNQFEIIIFNPPYLPSLKSNASSKLKKDDICWDGGEKGYELFLQFLEDVRGYLKPCIGSRVYYITSSMVNLNLFHEIIKQKGFKSLILDKTHVFFEDIILAKLWPF